MELSYMYGVSNLAPRINISQKESNIHVLIPIPHGHHLHWYLLIIEVVTR